MIYAYHCIIFVYDDTITISVNQLAAGEYFGTVNYEITGTGVTQQSLGRALTGSVVFNGVPGGGAETETVTWTIPANSAITEFTFTLTGVAGTASTGPGETNPALYYNFEYNALPTGNFVTVTNNNISNSEASHIHLVAGDPATTDIYLGDDDQYVKIEKNGGDVVIGTDTNNNHWTFGTNGVLNLPQTAYIYDDTATFATTSASQTLDSFSATVYRAAKYVIQATSGTDIHATELLVMHNDSTVFKSQTNTIYSSSSLITLDASIVSGNVVVTVTPANVDTVIDFVRTSLLSRELGGFNFEGDLQSLTGAGVDLETLSGSVDLNV
jgi:hypothetical protein